MSPNQYHDFRIETNECLDIKNHMCVLILVYNLLSFSPSVRVYNSPSGVDSLMEIFFTLTVKLSSTENNIFNFGFTLELPGELLKNANAQPTLK